MKYIEHQLYSTRREGDRDVEASFYVHGKSDGEDMVYRLRAMTQAAYEEWYLDREMPDPDGEPEATGEEDKMPLVVPESIIIDGLVSHVRERYLHQVGIDEIGDQFLEPITGVVWEQPANS